MYAQFFGLSELPFNNTPDPRFFYPTPDHEEALASLIYAVQERKGCVLLTGEVGAGKTLVARMMLRSFGPRLAYAAVNHGAQSAIDLMYAVCAEFELSFEPGMRPAQLVHILQDFLMERFAEDIPVALVLDEAQSLPLDAFEQLRMIGNLEADDAKLLQVVIVGQPELQRRFATREFCQLKQRIFRSFHLPAMEGKTTEGYIRHRLSIAGPPSCEIFDESAIDTIHKFSQGLPRIINTLCDNAMLSAYSADRREMDGSFIDSVIRQMMISPEPPLSALNAPVENRVVYESPGSLGGFQARETASLDWIARRVSEEVEARLSSRLAAARTSDARPGRNQGRDVRRTDDDAHGFDKNMPEQLTHLTGELAAQESETDVRLAKLEQQLLDDASPESQARGAQARLDPLVHRAGVIVQRAAQAAHDLERREVYMRTFSKAVNSAVDKVGERIDGLKRAVARTEEAESSAEGICSKLVAQSDRSRRIADEFKQTLTKFAAYSASLEAKQRLRGHTSAPAVGGGQRVSLPGGNGGITTGQAGTSDGMQRMLGNARQSLTELRSLLHQAPDHPRRKLNGGRRPSALPAGPDPSPPKAVVRPSTRLAGQVADLLKIVEKREKATV